MTILSKASAKMRSLRRSRYSVGNRIFFYSVVYLGLVTLMGSVLLFAFLWSRLDHAGKSDLESAFARLEPSIVRAAWQIDERSMETILKFFVSMDRVSIARFEDDAWFLQLENERYQSAENPLTWKECKQRFEFSLVGRVFKGQPIHDGKLMICVTRQADLALMLSAARGLALAGVLLIFLAALGPFYFYQNLVLSPINRLVHSLKKHELPPEYVSPHHPPTHPDEIDTLYSELHNRTRRIQDERDLSRSAFEVMEDGIAITDEDFCLIRFNPAFAKHFSCADNDHENKDIRLFFPQDCLRVEGEYVEYKTEDKSILECGFHDLEFRGRGVRKLIVIRDQTERRRIEAQRAEDQKMIAMGTLTGGVAHDFNNILSIIRAGAEVVAASPTLDVKNAELLEEIMHASEQGARLTSQMSSYVKARHSSPEIINLSDFLESTVDMAQRMLGAQHKLNVLIQEDVYIETDSSLLETSLLNLIINARDAIGESGKISLVVKPFDDPTGEKKNFTHIYVQNFGVPISLDIIERLCEPYFSTKNIGDGTGLGLFMVDGFVRQFGGEMVISSDWKNGTKIGFAYPICDAVTNKTYTQRAHDEIPNMALFKGNVLLVDDMDNVRTMSAKLLQMLGANVEEARSVDEVISIYSNPEQWDIIICDYALEGHTGLEILHFLRDQGVKAPFYFLSGYMPSEISQNLSMDKISGVLSKPMTLKDLKEVLIKHSSSITLKN